MQVNAEYPDGSDRLVEARERRIPVIRDGRMGSPTEEITVLEPVETDDWTFVFQVDGAIFRAIPLLDANTFAM